MYKVYSKSVTATANDKSLFTTNTTTSYIANKRKIQKEIYLFRLRTTTNYERHINNELILVDLCRSDIKQLVVNERRATSDIITKVFKGVIFELQKAMERFETEEFIHAVQAREPIWLTTNPKHKHKKTVNKMWNEIADQFPEMSKLALKKKWKNLRDSFKRELKKNPTSRSRWSYFDLMKFISPYEIATATHSQATTEELPLLEMPSQTHIRYTNVVDDLVPTNDNVNSVGVNVGVVGVSDGTTTLTTLTNASNIHCSNNFNRPRKRKLRQDEISVVYETKVAKSDELEMLIDKNTLQPIHHHQQHQQQQHQQQQQEQHHQLDDTNNGLSSASMVEFMVEKNDDYHFFMSLLPQMSKFEMLQKLRIRQHIQQIIIDEACILQNGYTTG